MTAANARPQCLRSSRTQTFTGIGNRRSERRHLQLHREHDRNHRALLSGATRSSRRRLARTSANYTVVYVSSTLTVSVRRPWTVTAGNARPRLRSGEPNLHRHRGRRGQRRHLHPYREHDRDPEFPLRWETYSIVPAATGTNLSELHGAGLRRRHPDGRTQATLTVTAANATRTYGAANPTFAASATGAVQQRYLQLHPRARRQRRARLSVPMRSSRWRLVRTSARTTRWSTSQRHPDGRPGHLTVTAGNASRAYGRANPTFTATATGAVNGDTFTLTESTTATTELPL